MTSLAERLKDQVGRWHDIGEHGRKGPPRAFAEELSGRLEGAKTGATYRSVLNYMNGVETPSVEWIDAAADLLGVRRAWLAFEEGARTEEEELAKSLTVGRDLPEAAGALRIILQAIPLDRVPHDFLALFSQLLVPFTLASWERADRRGERRPDPEEISRALADMFFDPLRYWYGEVRPQRFVEYATAMAAALRLAIPTAGQGGFALRKSAGEHETAQPAADP